MATIRFVFLAAVFLFLAPRRVVCRAAPESCTKVASPPAGSVCGRRTNPDSTFHLSSSQFYSLGTCIDYAYRVGAAAISHDSKTNLCKFFYASAFKADSTSTAVYYDISGCFTCTTNCNISPSVNLLENPNFANSEDSIAPWDDVTDTPSDIIPNPVGKGNALRYNYKQSSDLEYAVFLFQSARICADQGYLFTLDYKIDQLNRAQYDPSLQPLTMSLFSRGCTQTRSFHYNDAAFGKWNTIECSVRSATSDKNTTTMDSDAPSLTVLSDGAVNGTPATWNVTFANARMTRMTDTPLRAKGASLVANGGFESGRVAPWKAFARFGTGTGRDVKTTRPDPCQDGQPLTAVVSPGLPAARNTTRSSKNRLYFCGIAAKPAYYIYPYYADTSSVFFTLSQPLAAKTMIGQHYVLTVQYRVRGGGGETVQGIELPPINIGYGDATFEAPYTRRGTVVYQGLFQGFGRAANLTISMGGSMLGGTPPLERLQVELDNVSIKQADD